MIAQKMMIAVRLWASVIASAPTAYASRPTTYARLRPNRSPTLLLIRMNAAETRASSAIALCTALTVVSRSLTTAEIDTFISDVSTTSTNIAAASRSDSRGFPASSVGPLTGLFASHAIWPTLTAAGHTTIRTWVTDGRPPDDPPRPLCMHLDGRTSAGRSVAPACAIAGEENPPDPAAVLSFMAPRYWARGGGGGNGLTLPRGRLSDDKQLLSASPTPKRKRVMPLSRRLPSSAARRMERNSGCVGSLPLWPRPAVGPVPIRLRAAVGRRPSDPSIWKPYPRCAGRFQGATADVGSPRRLLAPPFTPRASRPALGCSASPGAALRSCCSPMMTSVWGSDPTGSEPYLGRHRAPLGVVRGPRHRSRKNARTACFAPSS